MTTKATAAAASLVEHRSVSLNNVVVAVEAQVHSVQEEQRLHMLDQQVHHLFMIMIMMMVMLVMMMMVMMKSSGFKCSMHLLVHHITHLLVRGGRAAVVGVDVHGSMAAEDDPGGDATVHAP